MASIEKLNSSIPKTDSIHESWEIVTGQEGGRESEQSEWTGVVESQRSSDVERTTVGSSNEHKVLQGFNLGSLGSVIRIDSSNAKEEKKKAKESLPMPVIVLDRSGSMGQWVTRMVRDIFPLLLKMSGYDAEQRVILITFDSSVERVKYCDKDPRVADLSNLNISSRGTTLMAPSIESLAGLLNKTQCNSHVLVVSDGMVNDMKEVLEKAQKHHVEAVAPLSFTLVRLLTSSGAQPDTRALACLGSWSNVADHTPVIDLPCGTTYSSEKFITHMLETSSAPYFRGFSGDTIEVEALGPPALRQTPLQSPVQKLQLYPKVSASASILVLVSPGVTEVKVNGEKHTIVVEKKPDEGDLMPLLTVVENQMRMWAVMGKSCSENMKKVSEWLTEVQARLATDELQLPVGNSTKARTQRLVMQIKHRQKQVISRIKELGNADLVAGFNAQQQAQFLRQTANTSTRRRLAKRAQNTDEELDFDGLCRDALIAVTTDDSLKQEAKQAEETEAHEEVVSFYSLSGFVDILEACHELAKEALNDDINAAEVLQIVGGLGIGFSAPHGDFPDPWQFRVTDVFPQAWLSEADVWLHHMQAVEDGVVVVDVDGSTNMNAHGLHISPPGQQGKKITGVMPLDLHPAARTAFRGPLRPIRELQAGLMMRRTLARIPGDVAARDTAVAWCIISQKMVKTNVDEKKMHVLHTSLTELEALTLARVLHNMKKIGGTQELRENMLKPDPRPWFTGDLDVSNVLKCIAITLRWDAQPLPPALLRAMFQLDAYHQCRKQFKYHVEGDAVGRKKALCEFLGLNLNKHFTPVKPLFEPEPETIAHYDTYDKTNVETWERLPAWIQSAHHFMALQRVCECLADHSLASKTKKDGIKTINENFLSALCTQKEHSVGSAFQVEHGSLFLAASYVISLLSTSESARVDKAHRVALMDDPCTRADTRAFLRRVVRDLVVEDYEARLKDKARQEAIARMKKLHEDLISATAFDAYVDLLQAIPSRSSDAFNTIHDTCLDLSLEIPLRGEKLWVLLTGRNAKGMPIWAQGNIMYGDLTTYKPVFEKLGKESLYRGVLKLKEKFGVYRYRDSTPHNRHGHGNDFPSWWALGFPSIHDMRAKVSESEWATYLSRRKDANGNVRPAPMEEAFNPEQYDRMTILLKTMLTDEKLSEAERKELIHLGKTFPEWGPGCRHRSRSNAQKIAHHAVKAGTSLASVKNKDAILSMIAMRKTCKHI